MAIQKHTCPGCSKETYRIVPKNGKDPGQIHCPDCERDRSDKARKAFLQGGGNRITSIGQMESAVREMYVDFDDIKRKVEAHDRILRSLLRFGIDSAHRQVLEDDLGDRIDRVLR